MMMTTESRARVVSKPIQAAIVADLYSCLPWSESREPIAAQNEDDAEQQRTMIEETKKHEKTKPKPKSQRSQSQYSPRALDTEQERERER